MKTINSVASLFNFLKVPRDSDVLIHGNAAISIQGEYRDNKFAMQEFKNRLIEYFQPNGTLLIPTFSYSFTKKLKFNRELTPSEIGKFSENFRTDSRFRRTNDPIFSFAIFGKNWENYLSADTSDCFGEKSVLGQLFLANGYLVFLGCSFNSATFVHFVEQKLQVPYRYFKSFEGVIENSYTQKHSIRYYVRNRHIRSTTNLSNVYKEGLRQGLLTEALYGRLPVIAIKTQDFFEVAKKLLDVNPYALIEEGFN